MAKKRKEISEDNVEDSLKIIEGELIKYNKQNEIEKNDINDKPIKKRKILANNKNIVNNKNVEFFCTNENLLQDMYNYNSNYVNKIYDKNLFHLDDLTQAKEKIFNKFHIEELFKGKDINSIKKYVHSFVITVNNMRESLVTDNEEKLDMLSTDCLVRFFIIEAKNYCNREIPNIKDIIQDENNLESININPLYNVIMDQKILITPNINKLSRYFIFIKWELEDKIKEENINDRKIYFGWMTGYPNYLEHNFSIINDKFKHIYSNINCNNNKQNEELLRTNEDFKKRLEILEKMVNQGK